MEKIKVKVINATDGKYDCDSITVMLDKIKTEICFDKKDNVSQFIGKDVYLSTENGIYKISNIDVNKK